MTAIPEAGMDPLPGSLKATSNLPRNPLEAICFRAQDGCWGDGEVD